MPEWYKLDNAGKIFPGQSTSKWSNIFRLSVVLRETVDPVLLERAVVETLPRFPCFDVRLRRGFFWYYFEKNKKSPPILPDIANPCHRVKRKENNGFLFRVYYYEKRISVEFFHALTDAYGVSRFLCTMTAQYLRLRYGARIPPGESVLDLSETATHDELADPFVRFASSQGHLPRDSKRVYHARGTKVPPHACNIITGYLPVDLLHAKAKSYGVTITEFLAAVMLDVHYQKQKRERRRQKQVSVQVPVNLRNAFPTKTLRNFSLTYQVYLDPMLGEYTFEEILRHVSAYLRYVNSPKRLNAMMTGNLKLETNLFMRVMPLPVKDFFIGLSFLITGEQSTSVLLSNLGVVRLPEEMRPYVDRFLLMPGPGKLNAARCASVSYGNTLALSVVNIYEESDIERDFFTRLVQMGIPVKIESNRC